METLLRTAAGVLANSEATADEVRAFARAAGLPLPPLQAAALGSAAIRQPDRSPPLAQPYFVVLGTIEPRKNHLLLLHTWRELVAQMGAAAPHLVVIGQRGWECENVIDLLERCESLRGVVHELSNCPDETVAQYLAHARALLFPSFAEGYGLPLVEALQIGTPVIASSLPVFSEIAGAVPDYLDPLDGIGWAQAIRDYADPESQRRASQEQRIATFVPPTWERHFEIVEDLLGQVR
jgi:glycosyltransferase involved in cell wall biosynthesis